MTKQVFKTDLRYIKTKNAIHTAFRSLMAQQDYHKITVKALTEEAHINRKTFYLHYNVMDDLLQELRDQILMDGIDAIRTLEIPADLSRIITLSFSYMDSLPMIDFHILHYAFSHLGEYRFIDRLQAEELRFSDGFYETEPLKRHFALVFIVNGIFRFYYEWKRRCPELSMDEAASLCCNFLSNGMSISAAGQTA